MPITNINDIPLSLAIWLANDEYDHNPDPNVISVTHLLKPIRAISLSQRTTTDKSIDLMDLVASRLGTAIHTAIEKSWDGDISKTLLKIGMPEHVVDRLTINPPFVVGEEIPIYMERRSSMAIGPYTLSGKFDFVLDGVIEDFKSTSTWAYVFQSNAADYKKQLSMYRMLNQDIVTEDHAQITYIFTDWSATKAKQDPTYPQTRIKCQTFQLMSIAETERYVADRFKIIHDLQTKPVTSLPECSKEDLWQDPTVWKYYKNPAKRVRSTRNFTDPSEANLRCAKDGNVGVVIKVPGVVKRCNYCSMSPICTQREQLEANGLL